MTDTVADLSRRALELEPEDRARLAEELLASLEAHVDPELDPAWDDALRMRVAELDAGTAKLVPADEVFARALHNLR